ncbi:NAD-dependent aldehyde dehydrogenase [Caulobacter sp. AP07]|uniref:aldehyde dehydrogenase family protein n=1 Tax=Caulobacter sp. AP07 TaxID=1144304 RepID=UPI0002720724|nr:aldehyde dehydrogenase family protein [Caulobacter sp. AP07]EJL27303.1 NAD-dependent aldehyde dehydrogenase [Caulobacter sp. AP07]
MTANLFKHDLSTIDPAVRAVLARKPAFYIDGQWTPAAKSLPVIDPSSGETVAAIGAGGGDEVDAAVKAAKQALSSPEWGKLGPVGRERLLHRLVALIEENAAVLAQVETIDNGMPSWFAFGPTILGAADVYRYYAGWPSKLAGETMPVEGPPGAGVFTGFTRREPVGVVAAIIPWNVPFMMAAWKLAPALAAGCTVVLKPAEDTSLTALMLADLAQQAGFPKGVINVVTGRGAEAGEALVSHPDVAKISFTGSTVTGRRIGEIAGRNLKKHTLELGGKSPTLVFDDADLDAAVPGAANSIFVNSGQICVAGSRLYVQAGVYDAVVKRLGEHLASVRVGAGLVPDVFMGPLVNAAQKQRVENYLDAAAKAGFQVLRGPPVSAEAGYFVSPAVVIGAGQQDAITQEEVFGPVLSVYRFADEAEAIALANDSAYGLAATIWSQDVGRVMRVSAALECGKVIVNNSGFPYAGLPEGGVKGSGHGRDLGREGVEACLRTKTVMMRISD